MERLGVARPVGKEDAVGIERQHVFGGGEGGDHGDAAAHLHQAAQDVELDAVIVGNDVVLRGGHARDGFRWRAGVHGAGPFVALGRGDAAGQVEAGHGGDAARLFDQLLRIVLDG